MASGTCGENLTWMLDDEGTLIISGTGEMKTDCYNTPWENYIESIQKVIIEDGVTFTGESAFIWCRNLTSVKIGSSVTFIGKGTFADCRSLTEITIPEGVKKIGFGAFMDCRSLKSIKISNSVTSIAKAVFYNCNALETIYYPQDANFIDKLREGNNAELIPY